MSGLAELLKSAMRRYEALPASPPEEVDPELDAHRRRQLADLAIKHRIPDGFRWAKLGTPEWEVVAAKSPKAATFARTWTRKIGSALILGPTGAGKTACTVALLHRLFDAVAAHAVPESRARWACDARFMTAADLVVSRRNSALGEESRLIQDAVRCSLLVMDEVGFEAKSTVPFEVVDARYRGGRPTIVTSGMRLDEFTERYGAAMVRRLKDRGTVVDLWSD